MIQAFVKPPFELYKVAEGLNSNRLRTNCSLYQMNKKDNAQSAMML